MTQPTEKPFRFSIEITREERDALLLLRPKIEARRGKPTSLSEVFRTALRDMADREKVTI